ncbi:MAG: hypothetical protein A2277_06785 [Desulfobacterales bacterium RIFOXYA12_FULL_46_15]|nr:MAG: hypothetical protein A2097_03110 [Desulfobacula sp. GWF2_41_7]OGR24779.1 MAG: hypothetical protein A2277_06785 [Desulfobacterales bacterium RIFOXYA12_FULL_46_15]
MTKFMKISILLLAILSLSLSFQTVSAGSQVLTDVKVIHASTGRGGTGEQSDSSLKGIIKELQSVFKYTSYRLLEDKRFNLDFNQQGLVNLPGSRTLLIVPSDTDGNRIRYQINIEKNYHSIFQTQVMLKNNSSLTIGGPELDNGVLLINISGTLQ